MTAFSTHIIRGAMAAMLLSGCATKVTRVAPDSTIDLSGRWNDTDARLVAEEMLKDCLSSNWYARDTANKVVPTVVVGDIHNLSHEHIATDIFIKDIERYLVNSGQVNFVANKAERQELRDETADQAANASVETRQVAGEESGADLMLTGSINSSVDEDGGKSVVFYQVNLQLVQIESHRILWIGDKKIKKFIDKNAASF
jgi:uncharacterized protein (TIGR02722 family)